MYHLCRRFHASRGEVRFPGEFGVLVHPLLRRFVVMSGGHCTYPTGGPAIRLNNKKTDEAQKAVRSLQLTRLLVECLPEDFLRQAFVDLGEIVMSSFCFSFCCPSGLLFYFFGSVLLSPLLGLSLQLSLVV